MCKQIIRAILIFTVITLGISVEYSFGQSFSYPAIKKSAQAVNDFVPTGWTILDSACGDLNSDRLQDAAIILQYKDSVLIVKAPEDTVLTQPRILLITFKDPGKNSFHLIAQSNSFILPHDNSAMEDPYQEMAINKGILEIRFQIFYNIGSWYLTNAEYKFKYYKQQVVLVGANTSSVHRATGNFVEHNYNFVKKTRSLSKGNHQDGSKKTSAKALNITELRTINSFSKPFTWEVEKGVYL